MTDEQFAFSALHSFYVPWKMARARTVARRWERLPAGERRAHQSGILSMLAAMLAPPGRRATHRLRRRGVR